MSVTWNTASETVFTEVTGTFTFLDDNVRAAYIDWDDGISNNKEKANFQWYTTPTATSSVSLSHTYTATGTYQPIVQTVNSDGFVSNYIGSKSPTNVDISPYTSGTSVVTSISITDGQGTGLLRTENKTVKSGIDNSIFDVEGPRHIYAQLPPIMASSSLSGMTFKYEMDLGVTYSMVTGSGYEEGAASVQDMITVEGTLSGGASGNASGTVNIMETCQVAGQGDTTSGMALVNQVLSVKYKNPKRLTDNFDLLNDMNKVKIFIVASSSVDGFMHPISYVSPGAPIKKVEDRERNVTLDFTQSRALASNVGIKQYRYDLGKLWFNPSYQWDVTGNYFNDNTVVTGSLHNASYTFSPNPYGYGRLFTSGATPGDDAIPYASGSFNPSAPWATGMRDPAYLGTDLDTNTFALDDFGRFPDQYHLARMSVQPSSAANLSSSQVSSIADNKPLIFRINPQGEGDTPEARTKADKQLRYGEYTSGSWYNGSGNRIHLENIVGNASPDYKDLSAANYYGGVGVIREKLLLLFDKKTNKLFFNISPYAASWVDKDAFTRNKFSILYLSVENPNTIKQKAIWKPLKYKNTTDISREFYDTGNTKYVEQKASYSKSGYLDFDMPSDWSAISMNNLCGGRFKDTTSTGPSSPVTNDFELVVSGQAAAVNDMGSPYGKSWNLSGSDVAAAIASGALTESDIGAYKYTFTIYADGVGGTGPTVGNTYWVASGADNGYNESTPALTLMYGDVTGSFTKPTTANAINGVLRRINVYDVVDGMSKVIPTSGSVGSVLFDSTTPERYWPVDYEQMAEDGTFPNTFVQSSGGTAFDNWSGSAKYPLKIVMKPAVEPEYVELWDIFDANNAYSTIIKEEDDSAYNLNSMSITSDISYSRAGEYYQAITRKGKVYIVRTGLKMESISFQTIATGDESAANAFTAYGAHSSLYGHLHTLRRLQSEDVRVYWDEIQKDGTYVRFWGLITAIDETHGAEGPKAIRNASFVMDIESIALLDTAGELMTDIFPLGGIVDDKDFT